MEKRKANFAVRNQDPGGRTASRASLTPHRAILSAFKLPRSLSYTAARAAEFHHLHPAGARGEMRENVRAPEIHAMGEQQMARAFWFSRGGVGGMDCLRKGVWMKLGRRKAGLDGGKEQDIVPSYDHL